MDSYENPFSTRRGRAAPEIDSSELDVNGGDPSQTWRSSGANVMSPGAQSVANDLMKAQRQDPIAEALKVHSQRKADLGNARKALEVTRDHYLDNEGADLFQKDPLTNKAMKNPDGTYVPKMGSQIDDLRTKSQEKVGWLRGALTTAVGGDPTDEAKGAQSELSQLEPVYKAKMEKFQRIHDQLDRVHQAEKDTEVQMGQLSEARLNRTPGSNFGGMGQPAAAQPPGGAPAPGAPAKSFDTALAPPEEQKFQAWKAKNAPNDSGADYDLRGAFKAGLTPGADGHWPDTFKKPNHPTFSDQSIYAKDAPDKAGSWQGDTFVSPAGGAQPLQPAAVALKPNALVRMHRNLQDAENVLANADTDKMRTAMTTKTAALRQKFAEGVSQLDPILQKRVQDATRDPSLWEYVHNFVMRGGEGMGTALVDTAEFAARNAIRGANELGFTDADPANNDATKFSQAMREVASDWGPDVSDQVQQKLRGSFSSDIAQGLGSTAAFMVPTTAALKIAKIAGASEAVAGVIARAMPGITGAMSEGNSWRREAEGGLKEQLDAGKISQEEYTKGVNQAEFIGVLSGATESASPLSRYSERLANVPAGRSLLRTLAAKAGDGGMKDAVNWIRGAGRKTVVDTISESGEEAFQELFQNWFENLGAKGMLGNVASDPGRDLGEGLANAAGSAGASAAIISALTGVFANSSGARARRIADAMQRGRRAPGEGPGPAEGPQGANPVAPAPAAPTGPGAAPIAPASASTGQAPAGPQADQGGTPVDEELKAELAAMNAQDEQAPGATAKAPEANATPAPSTAPTASDTSPTAGVAAEAQQEAVSTEKGATYDKSSTQITLPEHEAAPIRDFAAQIPDSDIYTEKGDNTYGREKEPHITALYGINNDDVEPVTKALAKIGPISVSLGDVSAFENKDKPFDVLKLDVDSPALHEVNAAIKAATDNSSDFPDYKPHLTLAYVKKGAAKKYVGSNKFAGKKITFNSLQFRTRDGRSIDIPLSGTSVTQVPTVAKSATAAPAATPTLSPQPAANATGPTATSSSNPQSQDARAGVENTSQKPAPESDQSTANTSPGSTPAPEANTKDGIQRQHPRGQQTNDGQGQQANASQGTDGQRTDGKGQDAQGHEVLNPSAPAGKPGAELKPLPKDISFHSEQKYTTADGTEKTRREYQVDRTAENPRGRTVDEDVLKAEGYDLSGLDAVRAAAAPIAERGATVRVKADAIAKQSKLKANDRARKFLYDFLPRLYKANPTAFAQMEIRSLSEAQWAELTQKYPKLSDSRAAFDSESNVMHLRAERTRGEDVIEAFVHEAGHFAEKYALGEKFSQSQWAALSDEQRSAAWKAYSGKEVNGGDLAMNRTARAEWAAMQFARVVTGDTEGMNSTLKAKLEAFLKGVREMVKKWVGDKALTTAELDAKIVEMLGYNAESVAPEGSKSPRAGDNAPIGSATRPMQVPSKADDGKKKVKSKPIAEDSTKKVEKPVEQRVEVGKNKSGNAIYADKHGVRSYDEGNFTFTEAVGLRPTREGMRFEPVDRKGTSWETQGEIDARTKSAPPSAPAKTPEAPKPAPTAKSKVDDLADKLFEGLLGTPAEPMTQAGFPKERRQMAIDLAEAMIEKGIRTPEAMAAYLDDKFQKKARKFSQSLWSMFGFTDPSLASVPDWNAIYSAKETPQEETKAPEETKTPEPAKTPEETKSETPAAKTQAIRDMILSADNRQKKAITMRRMAQERGISLKDMQEVVESELVTMMNETANTAGMAQEAQFKHSIEVYNKQPLFSARTSTSIENQAYSTPAPLAFALRHMTQTDASTRLYEPTAGNGMLMIGSDLGSSQGNELNDIRAAALRKLGVATVTQNDATKFVPKNKFDVVHANPPFGSIDNVNFDGFGIRKLEHLISLESLEAMKDGGSAALILGANMNNEETKRGAQWVFENYLYGHYNVIDNFEVDGELYAGQGAKWPVRVLVIAGRRSSVLTGELAPKTVDRLSTWDSIWSRADKNRNETTTYRNRLGAEGQIGLADNSAPGTATTPDAGDVSPKTGGSPGTASSGGKRGRTGGRQSATAAESDRGGSTRTPAGTNDGQTGAKGAANEPGVGGGISPKLETGDQGGDRGPTAGTDGSSGSEPASGEPKPGSVPESASLNDRQIPYVPRSGGTPFQTLTPSTVGAGTHAALDALKTKHGSIDRFVSDRLNMPEDELRKVLAADQIDGVALAIDQIENGGALIIGDETGIGKGRQAAALIRYAKTQEMVPLFFTKDPKLFSDMHGDLSDINTPINPFILGNSKKATIVDADGNVLVKAPSLEKQRTTMQQIDDDGIAHADHDSIFATYSQINTRNERQEFLERLAKKEKVLLILDEAHESAGDGDNSMQAAFMMGGAIKRGKGSEMTTTHIPGLLNLKGTKKGQGGVVYLSATYAKRPDNMPLYFRTDLSKASKSFGDIVHAMKSGGVALQQAVSEALSTAGQYIRRERDFKGVKYNLKRVEVKDEKALVRQVDEVTNVLSEIVGFSRSFRTAVMGEGDKSTAMTEAQIDVTDFAAVVHNQIGQLLLAAKADDVVNEALAANKRGEKPVITMMNTMESFLDNYVTDNNILPGGAADLSWKELLKHALSRTLRTSEKQPNGDTVVRSVSPGDYGLKSAYDRVVDMIGDVEVAFPVSPIDYIIQKLRNAGVQIGELTGRGSGIDYVDFEKGTGIYRRFKTADKNGLVNGFNSGKLDALLLNASGAVGLSIHASPKFKDSRKRHMIIAQPALDINTFVQTLGRIKRTGMIKDGAEYTHLMLPLQAEMRPAAVTNRKMKSLNANTTADSKGGVDLDVVDMLNKYGDQVVAEYLEADSELANNLGLEVEVDADGIAEGKPDLARKFMGRMALLSNEQQAEVYASIIPTYNQLIEQLKATNEYDLDIVVHDDWDGVQASDVELKGGTDESSLFTASVRAQQWEITDTRQVPTGDQMLREFNQNTGGVEKFQNKWETFRSTVDARMADRIKQAERELAEANARPEEEKKASGVLITSRLHNLNDARIQSERWNGTKDSFYRLFQHAGNPINLSDETAHENWDGMLIDVKFPDITKRLGVAPSRFQFKYLVDSPGGRMYVSGAKLSKGAYVQTRSTSSLADFKGERGDSRYKRWVVTGNPIAAYGATGGQGKMVRFKPREGKVVTGLLMRNSWDISKLAKDPRFTLTNGQAAAKFLTNQNAYGERIGIQIAKAGVVVSASYNGGFKITTPSNARARDYFLDPKLRALVGDFTKSGSKMIAEVGSADLGKVLEQISTIAGENFAAAQTRPATMKLVSDANATVKVSKPKPGGNLLGTPAESDEEDAEPKRSPKPQPVPGRPGEFYRSLPDTEREAGAAVVRQKYESRAQEPDLASADEIIKQLGEEAAMRLSMDTASNGIHPPVKTAIFVKLIEAADKRVGQAAPGLEMAKAIRARQALSTAKAPQATEQGQAISMYGQINKNARSGAIDQYLKNVDDEQERGLGGETSKKSIKEAAKELKKANEEAIAKATAELRKALGQKPVTKSLWQKYRDHATNTLVDFLDKRLNGAPQQAALSEFTNRVVAEMRSRLANVDEKLDRSEKPSATQLLAEAIANKEKYGEVFETVRDELFKQFAGDQAMLDAVDLALGNIGAKPYSKRLLDRAVKEAHERMFTSVAEVAKVHYTEADRLHRDMADALVSETGLSGAAATKLAADLEARMQEMTKDAKTQALEKLKKKYTTLRERKILSTIENAVMLNNYGALSVPELSEVIAKELKLPHVNPEIMRKISDIADRIETAKNEAEKARAEIDMLKTLRIARGITKTDVATSIWYANMLSGYTTHVANAVGNVMNGTLQLAAVMATNPKHAGEAMRGWLSGFGEGWIHAKSIMKTGSRDFDARTGDAGNVLELVDYKRDFPKLNATVAAGLQTHAKALRYVTRAMQAADAVFYYPAREARARVIVANLLEGKFEGKELYQKTREMLGIAPDQLVHAKEQAVREGFTGLALALRTSNIIEEKRRATDPENTAKIERYGREVTFNNEPEGWAGVLYQHLVPLIESVRPGGVPIMRAFLPFLRVPTNIFNASLNYTPLGSLRAVNGLALKVEKGADGKFHVERRAFDDDERRILHLQSIGGSLLMVGLTALALGAGGGDDEPWFDVTATGPDDFKKRQQLEATGWRPHSLKFGNTWISYKDSPLLLSLATVGHVVDAVRYKKQSDELLLSSKVANAVMTAPRAIFDTSMLSGLTTLMDFANGKSSAKQVEGFLARTAAGAAFPNLLNQIDRSFAPEAREMNGPLGLVGSVLPFVRNTGEVKTDILGAPVSRAPVARFGGFETNDPLREVLRDKGVFISTPGRDTKMGKTPMNEEQYREFVKLSGQRIDLRLRSFTATLRRLPAEQVEKLVDRVTNEERERAKNVIRAKAH